MPRRSSHPWWSPLVALDEAAKCVAGLLAADAKLPRHGRHRSERPRELRAARRRAGRARPGPHHQRQARPPLEEAFLLEERVGAADGHGVQAELGRQRARRGDLVAGPQAAAGDLEADLIHQLAVRRDAAVHVDGDQHGRRLLPAWILMADAM